MNKRFLILILAVVMLGGCRGTRLRSPVTKVETQDPIVVGSPEQCGKPVYAPPTPPPPPKTTCQVLPEMQEHLNCDPKTGLCYLPGHCDPVAKMETTAPGLCVKPTPVEDNTVENITVLCLFVAAVLLFLKGSKAI